MRPHQRAGRAGQGRRRRPAGVTLTGVVEGALRLFVVQVIDVEMLHAHLDERLHKLRLRILGQLGSLTDQRLNLYLRLHISVL